MKRKLLVLLVFLAFLTICWIGLRVIFPDPDIKNPRVIFKIMVDSKWPETTELKSWYFNNENERIAVFYFEGDTTVLQQIIKSNGFDNLSDHPNDRTNFNMFFKGFSKLKLPDYSDWDQYEGTNLSHDYVYIFLSNDRRQAICFANSW